MLYRFPECDAGKHGTHVAGTIAAEGNNGIGVTGVNWQAGIMVLKFLGPRGGYTSDAVEALNYAVNNGAKISNNSWGGGGRSQALQDAIAAADSRGHLFVAAAGNGGSDGVGDDIDVTPDYPASYSNPNIISVAATDDADRLASFSNYGTQTVDLGAPGVSILSTLPGDRYGWYSGTSMATPHVTGVAALIKSRRPELDDAQLKAQILQYVDRLSSLEGKTVTGGRLDAAASLGQEQTLDTTSPTVRKVVPAPGATGIAPGTNVHAFFSEAMEKSSINVKTLKVFKKGSTTPISAVVDYDAERNKASLDPSSNLQRGVTYKAVVTTWVKDLAGNRMAKNKAWLFTVRK